MKSWLNHHRHQLLQKQFTSVWYLDLTNVFGGVTPATVVFELEQIGFAEESTSIANVNTVTIRNVEETLF